MDDFLDVTGKTADVGKSLQNDNRSYTRIYGIDISKQAIQEYTDRAVNAIQDLNGKNEKLILFG